MRSNGVTLYPAHTSMVWSRMSLRGNPYRTIAVAKSRYGRVTSRPKSHLVKKNCLLGSS